MLANRLESLQRKHKLLHEKIEALYAEKAPDKYIVGIKKEKLQIKDEIEQVKKMMAK